MHEAIKGVDACRRIHGIYYRRARENELAFPARVEEIPGYAKHNVLITIIKSVCRECGGFAYPENVPSHIAVQLILR
jgi:hypothetical protein